MPDPNVKSGAMLGFKVGLQSTVDTILANKTGAVHGCFYLTQDSHRLYVGNEDGSISAVNEGIQTVTWTELQTISAGLNTDAKKEAMRGRFFYVEANPERPEDPSNILCVYDGTQWVQLNNNTDTYADGNSFAVTTSNGVATVTDTIHMNNDGTLPASFSITGDNGTTVSSNGTAITITGDTYELKTAAVANQQNQFEIQLDSTANDSAVKLIGGDNVTLSRDASSGALTITSQDIKVKSTALAAEAQGFSATVTDTNDQGFKSNTLDPTITVKDASGTAISGVHFVNGVAALDVYSTGAIDQKMKAFDAMTYRGTLGTSGTGATDISVDHNTQAASITNNGTAVPVSIGDTFLLNSDKTIDGKTYKAGSLIIVRALEGKSEDSATGIIAAGDYGIDIVAENWYSDTTYELNGTTNGVILHSSTDANVGSFIVTAGANNNWIETTDSGAAGANGGFDKTVTVTHKTITQNNSIGTAQTQGPSGSLTIPVISAAVDGAGHVTGVTTTNYTVTDTNGTLTSMSASTAADSNVGTVTVGTVFTHSDDSTDSQSASFNVSSSNLTITNTAASGNTPAGLAINMVWGSF